MRGGRFLSCRHGAMGVVHLVVVHGPGHGVDFSGIVCFVERFPRKEKKIFQTLLLPWGQPSKVVSKTNIDSLNFKCVCKQQI